MRRVKRRLAINRNAKLIQAQHEAEKEAIVGDVGGIRMSLFRARTASGDAARTRDANTLK